MLLTSVSWTCPYISSSDLGSSLLISESLSATLENPLAFQNKKKKNSDLSEGTKLKLKQKFLRTQETLKKKFAEAVAPGLTEEFINDVLTENTSKDEVPGDIQHALNYYEESDALGKISFVRPSQILQKIYHVSF